MLKKLQVNQYFIKQQLQLRAAGIDSLKVYAVR